MKKLIIVIFIIGVGIVAIAYAATVFESNTTILYSGTSGQTDIFQPLGTGYTDIAGYVGIYETQTNPTTATVQLEECNSNYHTCSTVASTTAFSASSTDGNQESSSSFITAYQMLSSKYYRLEITGSNMRFQCGNTSNMTPIVGSDATPIGTCAASTRAIIFKLYTGTLPVTPAIMSFNWIW